MSDNFKTPFKRKQNQQQQQKDERIKDRERTKKERARQIALAAMMLKPIKLGKDTLHTSEREREASKL